MNTINMLSTSNNRQRTVTDGLSTPSLFKHPNTTKVLNIASKFLLVSITSMVLLTIMYIVCHHHILQYLKHNITNVHHFVDIMFITISISIIINIITQVLFDKITLQIKNSTTLYKDAMAIIIGQQKYVLALQKKEEIGKDQLSIENTFYRLIELLTINVNTDKVAHLTLYDNIDALLVDFELQDLSPITTRMYLWIFQQRFLHLYNNHRVINNEYIQQCYKDDHLLISILLPIFDNSNDYRSFNKISKNLLSLLIEFDKLVANQNIVIIMDEAILQQYTLSITDVPNEQPTYLQNINLVLPSIGFESQVCKTEYPPLYNDVLPDHCIDIETCMMIVSRLWQYAEETEKHHLFKKYKSINTSTNSSFAFTYNQKVWKFALVEDDEIGSMNYMVFNCIKMLISSNDRGNTPDLYNIFFSYWAHYLKEHLQENNIYFKPDIIHQIIHIFFFHYRKKFIELLCTDNPEPLKIREIFSFDKVSPKNPYLGVRSVALLPQFLRLDEYCLPLVVIEESKLCFINFDKFFCGLILAFNKLMHKDAVYVVKECTTTKLVDIDKFTVPRCISRTFSYIPSATEILFYNNKNKISPSENIIMPFFINDNKLFAHIKEEDRIVWRFKTEVRQLIYIGKTHNCRSIFNEMKKILTLTERDYTNNPAKIRSLILYQLFMQYTSTEECCFNIMKIHISHIHKAIFYLCNNNTTFYETNKDLQYADFCNPIIIEVLQHRREIEWHDINDFNNKIYPAIFNLLYYFRQCVLFNTKK